MFNTLIFESVSKEEALASGSRFTPTMRPIDVLKDSALAYEVASNAADSKPVVALIKTEPLKTTTEQPIEDSHTVNDSVTNDDNVTDESAEVNEGASQPDVDGPLYENEDESVEGVDEKSGGEEDYEHEGDGENYDEFGGGDDFFDDDPDFDPEAHINADQEFFLNQPDVDNDLGQKQEDISHQGSDVMSALLNAVKDDDSNQFGAEEEMLTGSLLGEDSTDNEDSSEGADEQSVGYGMNNIDEFIKANNAADDENLNQAQEEQLNEELSQPKDDPRGQKPVVNIDKDPDINTDKDSENDSSNETTDENKEEDTVKESADSTDAVNEEDDFVSKADKLPALDAIDNLKQARLARINMSRPQTLALVKQSSLTSKATGYVPRLIANTQLNLYQKVPKMANDLFSLTSNMDAWLYKTFNLNFKAAQSIFALLPDFAKHAAAYYCTGLPSEHIIFDVSRRSQYFIGALVTLFKLKEMLVGGVKHSISIAYSSDNDFIELISAFEALASAVDVKYKKHSNPVDQALELISALLAMSLGGTEFDIRPLVTIGAIDDVFSNASDT
ncbi:MAG: hypothetical protein J6N72_02000, partial [Psychrobacter sp.]|nr:hypothetical protein [Psychrobacter sp.]